jgi:hypothetical protein
MALPAASATTPATLAAKPDVAIATEAVEISVKLDAGIKADPALAAECLTEGRNWAEQNRAEAEKTKREDPHYFPAGGYTFERNYRTRSVIAGRYVSVVRDDYSFTGGAHPDSHVDTILWDSMAARRISIRPFFSETADRGPTLKAIVRDIIASLQAQKKARDIDDDDAGAGWYKGIEPKLERIGAVTLAPSTETGRSSGLTFHYPPSVVGAHAEGGYVAFVPWERLRPYLTAEGLAIFGGARPRGDGDEP